MSQSLRTIATWTAVVVLSMILGGAAVVALSSLRDDSPRTVIQQVTSASGNGSVVQLTDGVADIYEKVRPSVVRITGGGQRSGVGSGVVVDRQGHILTNNHVITGFSNIAVQFWDGTSAAAQVVGRDPGNDLAVIKVDLPPDRLVPVEIGDSDKVRIGDYVIAIGNPFDLEGTLTQGVVSGVGRTLSGGTGRPLRQLIQADAAINPGNSGGGLFNRTGQLIGITTAIENPSGDRVFVGIGYAVPINTAVRFLPDMIQGRSIQHPRLGVALHPEPVTPALAAQLGLGVGRGVLIERVEPNSGAARAGLRGMGAGVVGDVIVEIDGRPILRFEDLAGYIDSRRVGDRISVKVVREGREMTFDVTLEPWIA
jgi:S1-C subfamily serine protease